MWRFYMIFSLMVSCQNTQKEIVNLNHIIAEFEEIRKNDKDQLWPEFNTDRLKTDLVKYKGIKSRMDKIQVEHLTIQEKINFDLLNLIIEDHLSQLEFGSHKIPLNAEGGFLAGIIYNIRDFHISEQQDFDKYLEKLKALPAYLSERIQHLKEGQSEGKSSPKIIVKNCLELIRQVLETPAEQSIFVKTELTLTQADQLVQIVQSEVLPAYQSLSDYLNNDYILIAPEQIGLSNITGGKEYYEKRVKYFTTFDISPEEVFQTGQNEVNRIRKEMEQIIRDLNFDGSFSEFIHFLRTDPQFYPQSGEELLKEAAWITSRIQGELPKYFTRLPSMPLTVKPVPEALAPNYTGGRYSGGSFDAQKAGQYWVNTYNLNSRPYYVLPALSLHEGVPGHHTQIMLANELVNVPEFRTKTYLSAFGEGWALYTEHLGKEMGIYMTPYEDFGRLVYEMWRACRLVVDPGMHYMGWTRQQAVEFMSEHTALSIHEINTEVNRYIGWPAQAVSYKMGELKIRELRQLAKRELDDQFDIRAFHDRILENGSIPLNSLERIILQYIKDIKEQPLSD